MYAFADHCTVDYEADIREHDIRELDIRELAEADRENAITRTVASCSAAEISLARGCCSDARFCQVLRRA